MKQKGTPPIVLERATKDRLGFISVALKQLFKQDTMSDSAMPRCPLDRYFGVPWTRTDIEGQDGVCLVRFLFEGLGEDYTVGSLKEIYEFDPVYEEVPIRAHPKFKDWIDTGYGTQDAFGNVYWYPDLSFVKSKNQSGLQLASLGSEQQKAGRNPLLGAEAWASMGGVWRKQYAALTLPKSIYLRVGTIVDKPPGPLPPIPKGRNFLRAPARIRWRGNAWEITEEWIMSGIGGHNPLIYDGSQEKDGS